MVSRRRILKLGLAGLIGIGVFSFCNHDDSKRVNPPQRINLEMVISKIDDFIPLSTPNDLDKIRKNLNGNYFLTQNLDFSDQLNFKPIGDLQNGFNGVFNGNGYSISNLRMEHPDKKYVGLFALITKGATVCNLNLRNIKVNASAYGSSLISINRYGNVINCNVFDSDVYSDGMGGGLVSDNFGLVQDSSYSGKVSGVYIIGGAVARNRGDMIGVNVDGEVNGKNDLGGLVGSSSYGRTFYSKVRIKILGVRNIGGIVGTLGYKSVLQDSSVSGTVQGLGDNIGNIVGFANDESVIEGCYSSVHSFKPDIGKLSKGMSDLEYFHHSQYFYDYPEDAERIRREHQQGVLNYKPNDDVEIELK